MTCIPIYKYNPAFSKSGGVGAEAPAFYFEYKFIKFILKNKTRSL